MRDRNDKRKRTKTNETIKSRDIRNKINNLSEM